MKNLAAKTITFTFTLIILVMIIGCGTDRDITKSEYDKIINVKPSNNIAIPDNRFAKNYKILLFGNSHVGGMGQLITSIIQESNTEITVSYYNAGGGFLDERTSKIKREKALEQQDWTHIILQGQKYSQSGIVSYSTTSAQLWIEKAKELGITPILFPEHPQKGNDEEGVRVHLIHKRIAEKQSACVAPIGLAWNKVILTLPNLKLHNDDGNHAAPIGKLLSAYVFYETITGESADLLPYIESDIVDHNTQQILKQIASETIAKNPPCSYRE